MIFAVDQYLCTPYRPLAGNLAKNDRILAECLKHPERFLVSLRSGDPRVLVARTLTDPDNAVWEVWKGATCLGILCLDHIVWGIEARLQFVFFDDVLDNKAELLQEFAKRVFTGGELQRLTFEAPAHMSALLGFAMRKLSFVKEATRTRAYFDGTTWQDIAVLRLFAEDAYG